MKKIMAMLALGIIASGYGFSQTSVWRISKGDKKIYLGGSVHMLRASDFPLPREFDVAFSNSDVLVLEADVKAPNMLAKTLSESMLSDGQTLKTVLTEKQYEIIKNAADEFGISMAIIEKMKPGMAIMTLTMMATQKINASMQGVDMYYYDKVASRNKAVDFLEGIDFQLDLICNTPFDLDEFIKYSVEDIKSMNAENEFDKLISDWRAGTATAEKDLKEMKQKFPSIYKAMFSDRNYKWLPKIEKYFEDDKTQFVLVGAAHLWGEDGLLNLLKKKGYKIGQLRMKALK